MEDVLDVYTRPHDPARPLVCLDESSKQLIAETRAPEAIGAERVTADLDSEARFLDELIGGEFREDQLTPEQLGELKQDRAAINEELARETSEIDTYFKCIGE